MDGSAANLPPEVLESVFSHLGKQDKASCSQVCRSWYTASCVPSLWRHEEARLDLDRLSPDMVRSLEQRRVGRVIVTSGCTGESLKKLLESLPNLEYLHLRITKCLYDHHVLEQFDSELPLLKTLKVNDRTRSFSPTVMSTLLQCASHLENLEVTSNSVSFSGDDFCEMLGSRLTRLKSLYLNFFVLTEKGIGHLTHNLSPNTASGDTSSIEQLDLKIGGLTNKAMKYIVQGFPSLSTLKLELSSGFDPSGLLHLGKLCNLEVLSIPNPEDTGFHLRYVDFCSNTVKRLHVLVQRRLEEEDVLNLPRSFPSLTHLEIHWGTLSLEAIVSLHSRLKNLQHVFIGCIPGRLRRDLESQGLGHLLQ